MRLALTILLLCAAGVAGAGSLLHDFEDEAPPDEFSVDGGRLSISGNCYKIGHHSLAWEIADSPSVVIYRSPDDFASAGKSPVLALWLHMPQPNPDTLGVELLRANKVIARGWFGLNFRGWRPLGAAWTDLGWRSGDAVDAIRFIAPENLAGSRIHIDGLCVDVRVAPPRPDDQQPWVGCAGRLPEASRTFHTSLDLAFNRPWLPAIKGADELTDADRQLMERAARIFAVVPDKPAPGLDAAQLRRTVATEYEVHRRDNGVVGRAIITGRGFHDPESGVNLSRYLGSIRDAASVDELRGVWLDMVVHLAEQGFSPGNANAGDAGDVSAVASLLAYPQELDKVGRLADVVDTTIFLLLADRELTEKPAIASPDWPVRLRTAFAAAALLPSSPQKLQRLQALSRCFDRCIADDKASPASESKARQVRDLAADIVGLGLRRE